MMDAARVPALKSFIDFTKYSLSSPVRAAISPGWYLVPTGQRLGLLAAWLLEPASEDGLATWNFLDRDLRRGQDHPVLRVRQPLLLPGTAVP